MIKDPTEPASMTEPSPQTISDVLDRLEVTASKIGQLAPEQATALLHELDAVYVRLQSLELGSASRKIADAQFSGVLSTLKKGALRFIRDLGGLRALQQMRAETNPPAGHEWWYLDEGLARHHRAAARRLLITGGVAVLLMAVLSVLYNRYLAPSPQDAARYGHQQNAGLQMQNGDFAGALQEINQGLQIAPQDPELLILKGIVQEQLGQNAQAVESFAAAQKGFENLEEFLLTRGQAYINANLPEKAFADAQAAVRANPQFASAYLLRGQVYETQQKFQAAMDDYDQAFRAAEQAGESELAAIARVRIAYLTQSMNAQSIPGLSPTPTNTPAP